MASVDVAIPSYQYGHLLRDCVLSVLTQGIRDLRVLIVDNASTDSSARVARELVAHDSRVEVVIHSTNLGQHASFNEGIDWASSDYFMVLCADDLLAPGCLARALSVMEANPDVVFSYGRTLTISTDEPIPAIEQVDEAQWRILAGERILERFCTTGRCHVPGPTVVVRTAAQKRAGYYRAELPHTDDFEMWMRLACLGRVAETERIQAIARTHSANRCASVDDVHLWDIQFEAAFESFFKREGAAAPNAVHLRQAALRALAERAYWSAMANLLRGHGRLGLSLLTFAFTRRPSTIILPPISYLMRRDDVVGRTAQVLSEAIGWRRVSVGESHVSQ